MKHSLSCTIFAVLTWAGIPLAASVGLPVQLTLVSPDAARAGEPASVYASIRAGVDMAQVRFSVPAQQDWQILDGSTHWIGALVKDQEIELVFRVAPLSGEPRPLLAMVTQTGGGTVAASMDARHMGALFRDLYLSDAGDQHDGSGKAPQRAAEGRIEATYDPAMEWPEPASVTAPRIPRLSLEAPGPSVKGKAGSRQAAVNVTATGRWVYRDEDGIDRPVRGATVELWNLRSGADVLEDRCRVGITDGNGNFSLTGNCGDFFDGPDLAVRLVLNNSFVEVKPDGGFTYVFQSSTLANRAAGAHNFGTLRITENAGAAHLHNLVMRARQFMASEAGESIPKVTLLFPSPMTMYIWGGLHEIRVLEEWAFEKDAAFLHEYGHHILFTRSDFPFPDYSNGNCDDDVFSLFGFEIAEPGHCPFEPEKDEISWTEGWPDYFAKMVWDRHQQEDGLTSSNYARTQNETRPRSTSPAEFAFNGQEDKVRGFIAAILLDLTDAANDDQEETGAGRRDAVQIPFRDLWDVVRNFDPEPNNLFRNHPVDIHQFWAGMRARHPERINAVSEVYREHRILKAQPDLVVSAAGPAPAQISAGGTFVLSNTVRNSNGPADDETARNAFTVRFLLEQGTAVFPTPILLATRTVPAGLGVGASNTALTTLAVPVRITTGTYRLRVCADSGEAVAERDETNNCLTVATSVLVTR